MCRIDIPRFRPRDALSTRFDHRDRIRSIHLRCFQSRRLCAMQDSRITIEDRIGGIAVAHRVGGKRIGRAGVHGKHPLGDRGVTTFVPGEMAIVSVEEFALLEIRQHLDTPADRCGAIAHRGGKEIIVIRGIIQHAEHDLFEIHRTRHAAHRLAHDGTAGSSKPISTPTTSSETTTPIASAPRRPPQPIGGRQQGDDRHEFKEDEIAGDERPRRCRGVAEENHHHRRRDQEGDREQQAIANAGRRSAPQHQEPEWRQSREQQHRMQPDRPP